MESRSVRNHERRTPITLIAGHAEGLLRSGPQPPALQLIQQEAQRMGTLITDLLDLARNHASGDPHRLQQGLTALVDNALLYSPAPSPGVPSEEREAIFGRFVRGSAGLASPRRGSGIGLSVVRLLIEPMGGRVQVVDHPGGGADFQLLLPGLANP